MRRTSAEQEKMYSIVEEYIASGLSLSEFSRGKGIDYHKLDYWQRKKRSEGNAGIEKSTVADFIEIGSLNQKQAGNVSPSPSHVVLTFASGLRLEIFG
jgi:transposase-like protein